MGEDRGKHEPGCYQGGVDRVVRSGEALERQSEGKRPSVAPRRIARESPEEEQSERPPLQVKDVHSQQLPLHEAVERNEGSDEKAGAATAQEFRDHEGRHEGRGEQAESGDEIEGQHGIPGEQVDGQAEEAFGQKVVAEGQAVAVGIERVRLEEGQGVAQDLMRHPGHRPGHVERVTDIRRGVSGIGENRPAPGEGQQGEKEDGNPGSGAVVVAQVRILVRFSGQRTIRSAAVGGTGVLSPESAFSTAKSAIFSTAHGKWASLSER